MWAYRSYSASNVGFALPSQYGVVYKAQDRLKHKLVALKKASRARSRRRFSDPNPHFSQVRWDAWVDGVPATALREISVLKEIRHENIVGLEDVFVSYSGNLYLVFELLDLCVAGALAGGSLTPYPPLPLRRPVRHRDLKQYMDHGRKRETGLDAREVRSFLYQLLLGIDACHSHRVVHRDIKVRGGRVMGGEGWGEGGAQNSCA